MCARSRDAWQLNERRVVLCVFNIVLAVAATVRHVLDDRSQALFDEDTTVRLPSSSFAPLGRSSWH